MKKILSIKNAILIAVVVSFTIYSSVKGYQYIDSNNLPIFLLENAEALANGESAGGLVLKCKYNELESSKCYYRCSCNRLYESTKTHSGLEEVSGACPGCGAIAH